MSSPLRFLCPAIFALASIIPTAAAASATVIYLTRHAEKAADSDPPLTAKGQTRAQNLAAILKKADIKHIYSTNFRRTMQTAQPLATRLALPVQKYDPAKLADFARELRALPGNSLVVGHSDTTTELLGLLGGAAASPIAETEFDRLYQVVISQNGEVTTTLLNSLPSP
jgi:broad specificity phosphatase PhoE